MIRARWFALGALTTVLAYGIPLWRSFSEEWL